MLRLKSLSLLLVALFLITGSVLGQQYKNGLKQGAVRVKFKPQISATLTSVQPSSVNGVLHTGIQAFDKVNTQLQAVSMKRVFPYSPKHEAKHKQYGLDLWYEVTYTSGLEAKEAVAGYASLNEVNKAEAIRQKTFAKGQVEYASTTSTKSEGPFNDPLLDQQWHYSNDGSLGFSVVGGDINLYEGWEIETGKPNVVVCIVDGGIDIDHEDLAANVWVNEAEKNGEEGVDDDGNGYIDDINGFNFITNKGDLNAHYHGTHVAGTVAAVNNNNVGVAGVAGGSGNNDGVRLMSSQIFSEVDAGVANAAAAIAYGADNGAVISQNSWGYPVPGQVEQAILDAIDYFVAEAGNFEGSPMKGGIVLIAAGNEDADGLYYPGCYESAIAVSSFGPDLKRADYSNYGTWVDIAAPGGNIDHGRDHGILSTLPGDKYGFLDGTSMACPHVSGVAALIVSKFGGSNFTNEDLKVHVLTGTHDIDTYNPDYAGKLGVGYLDSRWALQTNNEMAPNAVSDLNLIGVAQDFANISWSVPADEDDLKPVSFEVIYSTTAITNENADLLDKIDLAMTLADTVGTVKEYEIQDLKPTTDYYFAIRSVDRWGNVSEISNVATGRTNAGPAINTDKQELNFTIDASVATTADDVFAILNEDVGVLNWEGFTRHKQPWLSYNNASINYPKLSATTSSSKTLGHGDVEPHTRHKNMQISTMDDTEPSANFFDDMCYSSSASNVVGDEDINITNSIANRYYVDKEAGFNLTFIEAFLQHTPSTGPMVIEIYQGDKIHENNLMFAEEFSSYNTSAYWHSLTLSEQLFFEQGATFWIVIHVPAGNLYPLGMGWEESPEYSDNCFYSTDLGAVWTPMNEAIGDDRFVWNVAAVSKNKHLGNYITLNPSSGTVEGNSKQDVALSLDASKLINGTYSANVVLESNDGDDRFFRMPVSLTLTGQLPKLVNTSVVDFGGVFFGHSKEMTITIENVGYGNFNVASAVSTDSQFEIIQRPYQIAAQSSQELTIKYTPNDAGNDNGSIEFTDQMGRTHSVNVFGVAAAPSEITVSPATQQLPDMGLGETASTSVTISNTGDYPLEYVIPAFAPDVEIEGMDAIHKFGYTVESNVNGATSADFVWSDLSKNAADVTDLVKRSDYAYRYLEVDLGFDFPFYGEKFNKINLTRLGVLTFDQGNLFGCSPAEMHPRCSPAGFISALASKLDLNLSGSVKYKREPGKFIVEYANVVRMYEWNTNATATFQIVLFYNGDVELRYKDIENFAAYNLQSALVGISDPAWEDGVMINGYLGNWTYKDGGLKNNETIYRLKSPGQSLITEVSEPHGILKVGESKTIDVKLSTEGMNESNLYQRLSIACNDPFNNPAAFTVKVNVNSGGVSDVKLNKTEVNLGSVFQAGESHDLLVITNEGNKDVELTAINWTNDKFIIEGDVPVLLQPNSTYYIPVEINTSEIGVFDDVLVIETNEGGRFEAQLHAEVIPAPAISVDISSISETLNAGEMVSKIITVTNDGESDLEIIPAGNDWLYLAQAEAMSAELPEFSYYSQTSDDTDGPAYSWLDVRKNGTKIPMSAWADPETDLSLLWKPIALPFEIEFYQQKTDSIWISWEGVISMSKPTVDGIIWPDPLTSATEPNNIIAPYFAQQNFDYNEFPDDAGVSYQIFDDRVVVQWSECYDGFGMGDDYSFQAIMFTNGNIKFQYKTGQWSYTSYGAVGIKNADGTDCVQLAYMQNFIKNELAVSFSPAKKEIVPAGQSKQFTVAVDASLLNKGDYEGNFQFFNNTPTNSEVKVSVNLTVNGEAAMEASTEAFEFGEKMAYTIIGDFGPEPMSYYQSFSVGNNGRDVLNFTDIAMVDGSDAVAEIFAINWFGWGEWSPVSIYNLASLKPGESAKLRLRLFPSGNAAEVNDTLVFSSNSPDGDFKLPVHAMVILPPVVGVDQDSISVVANTIEDVSTRSFVIDNIDGQSVLDYHIGISYNRKGEEAHAAVASLANTIATPLVSELIAQNATTSNLQLFADETYNATLEHDTLTEPTGALGFGESLAFITGTAFQAPADGFNLTHVKTMYYYQDVLESRITVEIRGGGTSVIDAKVLSRESFDVVVDNPQEMGEYFTFELSENQIFFPGETFYVVFEYQLGVAVPQAMANGLENVDGRFMYSNGEEWGDIQSAGYSGEGWMVKAMEKEHKSKSWAVIDGAVDGSVPVGESVTVKINFLPVDAVDAENDAIMTIATNDPMNPESVVNLNLRINQGPQFDLESGLSVKENESLNFVVPAQDVEGDVCTYALADKYEFLQMSVQNDTISFVYTPDFESAGTNTFSLVGEDTFGNTTIQDISIEVINVNRAPEVINPIATREYYEDGEYDEINLTSVFEDPDGDALTYRVYSDNEDFINIFISDEDIIIKSQTEGTGVITVVAVDSEGLGARIKFEVIVGTVTGIEDVEGSTETKVYPVPTTGPLNVVLGNDIEGEVNISIINITGLTQYQTTVNKMSGEHIERLNISNMPSGIYLVKITSAKGDVVKRVVKI